MRDLIYTQKQALAFHWTYCAIPSAMFAFWYLYVFQEVYCICPINSMAILSITLPCCFHNCFAAMQKWQSQQKWAIISCWGRQI